MNLSLTVALAGRAREVSIELTPYKVQLVGIDPEALDPATNPIALVALAKQGEIVHWFSLGGVAWDGRRTPKTGEELRAHLGGVTYSLGTIS